MKNGAGAARLICVFTVCILLLGYNFYGRLLKLIKSAEKSLSGMENAAGKDALARKKLMKEIYWQYIEMKARYMEENNADH